MIWTLFSQPRLYPTFPFSCVWNSVMFSIMFYKLQTCSDSANSYDFFSKCLFFYFPYSSLHVVHPYFIQNFFWDSVFKFVFRRFFFTKKLKKRKKYTQNIIIIPYLVTFHEVVLEYNSNVVTTFEYEFKCLLQRSNPIWNFTLRDINYVIPDES